MGRAATEREEDCGGHFLAGLEEATAPTASVLFFETNKEGYLRQLKIHKVAIHLHELSEVLTLLKTRTTCKHVQVPHTTSRVERSKGGKPLKIDGAWTCFAIA